MTRLFAVPPVENVISPITASAVGPIGTDEESEATGEIGELVRRCCVHAVINVLFIRPEDAWQVDVDPVAPIPARVLEERLVLRLAL